MTVDGKGSEVGASSGVKKAVLALNDPGADRGRLSKENYLDKDNNESVTKVDFFTAVSPSFVLCRSRQLAADDVELSGKHQKPNSTLETPVIQSDNRVVQT